MYYIYFVVVLENQFRNVWLLFIQKSMRKYFFKFDITSRAGLRIRTTLEKYNIFGQGDIKIAYISSIILSYHMNMGNNIIIQNIKYPIWFYNNKYTVQDSKIIIIDPKQKKAARWVKIMAQILLIGTNA